MSWGQPGLPQTTYNEIISSGKHSLIRNEELRHRISEHYQFTVEIRERGNARVGDYSKRAYELLPRNSERMDIDAENELKEGLSEAEYKALAESVLNSDLNLHITPLKNRYLMIQATWTIAMERATELIEQIDAELVNR